MLYIIIIIIIHILNMILHHFNEGEENWICCVILIKLNSYINIK